MRRHTTRVVVSLLFGVLACVTTAWVIPAVVIWGGWTPKLPMGPVVTTRWTDGERGGHYMRIGSAFSEVVDFKQIIFAGRAQDQPFYNVNAPPSWASVVSLDQREGFEQVATYASGWPWRSGRMEIWFRWNSAQTGTPIAIVEGQLQIMPDEPALPPEEIRKGWLLGRGTAKEYAFPADPIWPGMLGNIAVFGGGACLLWTALGLVRSQARGRRGRCLACGYQLAEGATACPECGAS